MTMLLFLLALLLIGGLLWSIQHWSISKDPYFGSDASNLIVRGLVNGAADMAVGSDLGSLAIPPGAGADGQGDGPGDGERVDAAEDAA